MRRKQTNKYREAYMTNWLIYRLRGYETLLKWLVTHSTDNATYEQADAALDLTRNLIHTIKTRRSGPYGTT